MIRDYLDDHYTYVRASLIPNSGEGLFAKVDIPKGTTICQYGGVFVNGDKERNLFSKPYDDRKALFNSTYNIPDLNELASRYHISLRHCALKDAIITLHPQVGADCKYYNATLAHKANHRFSNTNALLGPFMDTPRFGLLPVYITTQDIKKDEEIFVDYGYPLDFAPEWYKKMYEVENPEERLPKQILDLEVEENKV